MDIIKYPRTRHIEGSRLQKGDEDLKIINFDILKNEFLVIEEKIDGANSGISFNKYGDMLLQSRGHYLTGGFRERHFALFKTWTGVFQNKLFELLGDKYIMYGEWMFAKHTVFYDKLPNYFMEFDIFDKTEKIFLSTAKRRVMLKDFKFICSVPVLYMGQVNNIDILKSYLNKSLYKSTNWEIKLINSAIKKNLNVDLVKSQTDMSDLAEGLYIKVEENNIVKDRMKFVRNEFVSKIASSNDHWLNRPILENELEDGEVKWE